jgi:hypothetical protein
MGGWIIGYIPKVLVGATVFLFVFRYNMISAIQSRHTLNDFRNSVERSASNRLTLEFE